MREGDAETLIAALRSRLPILDHVAGRFGGDSAEERIPWFFGLLLSASLKNEAGACCFVLDKTPGTTAIAAVITALARLKDDFPRLATDYARTGLTQGQRVLVKPSNFVYEYEGIWEGYPNRFRLKELDKDKWRSFRVSEVLRLEPTTRKRPKGTLTSRLGTFEGSPLDRLLEVKTFGNDSLIRNVVMLYMAQARFSGITKVVSLTPRKSRLIDQLSSFLPWGTIGPGGVIQVGDAYQVVGEPLIAVSRVLQDLAEAAVSAPEASKVVFVDGARSILRDLQAFDDMAERQRVVILASPDETDEVRTLIDRDCPVWHLSTAEILIGEDHPRKRSRQSLVGRTVRQAHIRARSNVVTIDCESDDLQAVAAALEDVAKGIRDTEDQSETESLLARLYGLLLDFSECCFGVGQAAISDLRLARKTLVRDRKWMTPEIIEGLQFVIDRLENVLDHGPSLQAKADALLSTLKRIKGSWVLACRSPKTAKYLRQGLGPHSGDLQVLPIQELRPEDEWDGVILSAWPGGPRFTRLKNLRCAPAITVLAYPFERRWLLGYRTRERALINATVLPVGARAELLGIEPDLLPQIDSVGQSPPPNNVSSDQPMLQFERRVSRPSPARPRSAASGEDVRKARLVEFYGGCYALLTEWSQLHVLNDLIEDSYQEPRRLRTVTAADLSLYDFVLFRAGGDKEFIRLLAEDELGFDEYERIRAIAERWKTALRDLGSIPARVQRRLEEYGLNRTLPTIGAWLANPDLIGPRSNSDVEIIARAANDMELLENVTEVTDAISRIRGAHIVAGGHLTQLIVGEVRGHIDRLDDQPKLLDLGYGHGWVVQVQAVDSRRGRYPADQVNRLLWKDRSI